MKKNYLNVFDLLYSEFERKKIPCILAGGFALSSYGSSRQTVDVDFFIKERDYPLAKELVQKAGYEEYLKHEIFARFKHEMIQFMDLDLMFLDDNTFNQIVKEAKKIKIADNEFYVPSLNHLIAMKLHAIKNNETRIMKDLPDIVTLIRKNSIDPEGKEFKDVCLRFGSEEIYKTILKYL